MGGRRSRPPEDRCFCADVVVVVTVTVAGRDPDLEALGVLPSRPEPPLEALGVLPSLAAEGVLPAPSLPSLGLSGVGLPSLDLDGVGLPPRVLRGVPWVMKCADMLSPLRGVRASCEVFTAFATLPGTSLRPFAVAVAAAASPPGAGLCAGTADVDTAPAAACPLAGAAPSWLLRDCLCDSRLLLVLLPPAPLGLLSCEDRCPLRLLPPLTLGEERPAVSTPPSRWRCLSRREDGDLGSPRPSLPFSPPREVSSPPLSRSPWCSLLREERGRDRGESATAALEDEPCP